MDRNSEPSVSQSSRSSDKSEKPFTDFGEIVEQAKKRSIEKEKIKQNLPPRKQSKVVKGDPFESAILNSVRPQDESTTLGRLLFIIYIRSVA